MIGKMFLSCQILQSKMYLDCPADVCCQQTYGNYRVHFYFCGFCLVWVEFVLVQFGFGLVLICCSFFVRFFLFYGFLRGGRLSFCSFTCFFVCFLKLETTGLLRFSPLG